MGSQNKMDGKTIIGAIAALALLGCGSGARKMMGPDGTPHLYITCRKSIEKCLARAAKECPRGYRTASSEGGNDGAVVYSTGYGAVVANKYRGSMLIKCR